MQKRNKNQCLNKQNRYIELDTSYKKLTMIPMIYVKLQLDVNFFSDAFLVCAFSRCHVLFLDFENLKI